MTRVLVMPRARALAEIADSWWRTNRPAAPRLFTDALARALDLLAGAPMAGAAYRRRGTPGIRRLLMPECRCHVCYVFDAPRDEVQVLAVWSAERGRGPTLRGGRP